MTLEEKEAHLKELSDEYIRLREISDKIHDRDRRAMTISVAVLVLSLVFAVIYIVGRL